MTKTSRKIGLALSGGGARGLAHIGVLEILEREGVPIDYLAGTSMGGVIAAGYAAGLSPNFLEQEALRMANLRRLLALADPSLPRRGFLEGQKVRAYLIGHLGDRTFDDLRLPLALVAVDLNDGSEVILRDGRVVDAVRATISLPGVFTPVERDGQLLVDGGLLNNLPADVVRQMGADVVIAVNTATEDKGAVFSLVEAAHRRRYIPNGLVDTLEVPWRSVSVMMAEINRHRLAEARPEVIVRPAIPQGVTLLTGFPRAAEIIATGKEAATRELPRIRGLLAPTGP
jgi:NTE family protein